MRDDAAVKANWFEHSFAELRDENRDLPFMSAIVQKVIDERSLRPGCIGSIDDLGDTPTTDALLNAFIQADAAHEFLAFYIEELRDTHRCSRQEVFTCTRIAVDPEKGLHMCADCGDAYMHGF